jgi:hypothetical protein
MREYDEEEDLPERDFVANTAGPAPGAPGGQLTLDQWLGRGVAGLGLGYLWACVVALGWVGLATVGYGTLDNALERLPDERWYPIALAGFFASVPASFLGGLVGPLSVGRPRRVRRPVLTGSACGSAISAVLGLASGLFVGWATWEPPPRSMLFIHLALAISVPTGLGGGWLGGRLIARV